MRSAPVCPWLLRASGRFVAAIHDGNFDFGVVADALFRPAAGIAADVEQLFNRFGEHGFQGFGKGIVGIIVVEGEPFFCATLGSEERPS